MRVAEIRQATDDEKLLEEIVKFQRKAIARQLKKSIEQGTFSMHDASIKVDISVEILLRFLMNED